MFFRSVLAVERRQLSKGTHLSICIVMSFSQCLSIDELRARVLRLDHPPWVPKCYRSSLSSHKLPGYLEAPPVAPHRSLMFVHEHGRISLTACTTMVRPQICASRNSCFSMRIVWTCFQIIQLTSEIQWDRVKTRQAHWVSPAFLALWTSA